MGRRACKNVQSGRGTTRTVRYSPLDLRNKLSTFFLSAIVIRVHFDSDFVAQSGRQFLDVTLHWLARL